MEKELLEATFFDVECAEHHSWLAQGQGIHDFKPHFCPTCGLAPWSAVEAISQRARPATSSEGKDTIYVQGDRATGVVWLAVGVGEPGEGPDWAAVMPAVARALADDLRAAAAEAEGIPRGAEGTAEQHTDTNQ